MVIKETGSGKKVYDLEFETRKVSWPGRTELLNLVVVDGLGQNPLMLLTNRRVIRSRKSQWRIVKSHLSRWQVEETIRFIKQSHQLEDIRVLKYERLRNLAILVRHIERVAGRIYGVPSPGSTRLRMGSSSSCLAVPPGLDRLVPIPEQTCFPCFLEPP